MAILSIIRRWHFRDHVSLREIAKRLGISRNTVRRYIRAGTTLPAYPERHSPSKLDGFAAKLAGWLKTEAGRPRKQRRTLKQLHSDLCALGFTGSYDRVAAFARRWRQEQQEQAKTAGRGTFIPLRFAPGEAFQFDWSEDWAVIDGERTKLQVAQLKLSHSRAFFLRAYPLQTHEMLFDAEFCNVASGWEKGQIEKNVQDSRHRLWQKAPTFRTLAALNDWLADQCVLLWQQTRHPEHDMTIWEAWSAERPHLMPVGQPFDGFVEHTKRVSPTCLITFERNRYSVPASFANRPISLRVYAAKLVFAAEGQVIAEHVRRINRSHDNGETIYDWRHYLTVLQRKPGALRNGAPFAEFPAGFRKLQGVLLKRPGGDREMVEILALVLLHDEQAVLAAVELALEAGVPSKQTVLNILSRLLDSAPVPPLQTPQAFALEVEPQANVDRYDSLRGREDNHAA